MIYFDGSSNNNNNNNSNSIIIINNDNNMIVVLLLLIVIMIMMALGSLGDAHLAAGLNPGGDGRGEHLDGTENSSGVWSIEQNALA